MKIYSIAILAFLMLTSCTKWMNDHEPLDDFFTQTPHVLPSYLALGDSMSATFISPNAFTPGRSQNATFQVFFTYVNIYTGEEAKFDYFRIYDHKKRLVRELDELTWDGTDQDGKVVFGEYSYEASLILPRGQQVKGIGYILSIGDCADPCYATKYMQFPDEIHPRLGFILSTSAEIDYCDE